MKHVAIVGKSRAGKDTVAGILVRHASYTRLAFADKLKEAALRVDPIILAYAEEAGGPVHAERLAELVEVHGWEFVKDTYPEARRFLQEYGQTVREMDPEFWIRPVAAQVVQGTEWNMPCVVSDVRYRNEVDALRELGAVVVRVVREGSGLKGTAGRHDSETELDGLEPDYEIRNDGSKDELYWAVRDLYGLRLYGG